MLSLLIDKTFFKTFLDVQIKPRHMSSSLQHMWLHLLQEAIATKRNVYQVYDLKRTKNQNKGKECVVLLMALAT